MTPCYCCGPEVAPCTMDSKQALTCCCFALFKFLLRFHVKRTVAPHTSRHIEFPIESHVLLMEYCLLTLTTAPGSACDPSLIGNSPRKQRCSRPLAIPSSLCAAVPLLHASMVTFCQVRGLPSLQSSVGLHHFGAHRGCHLGADGCSSAQVLRVVLSQRRLPPVREEGGTRCYGGVLAWPLWQLVFPRGAAQWQASSATA